MVLLGTKLFTPTVWPLFWAYAFTVRWLMSFSQIMMAWPEHILLPCSKKYKIVATTSHEPDTRFRNATIEAPSPTATSTKRENAKTIEPNPCLVEEEES